jgi:amino acid adenylation domain-containing protein/non-ribosomal peptide synthase protein (TIGR01720 family)
LARQVKEIKERLNRVPGKGIGYGILKYLTREVYKRDIKFKQKPRISFNYLGQFDADVNRMSFSIAEEPVGKCQSEKGERVYELDVTGMIIRKQLRMTVVYNREQYKTETMEIFLDNYKGELRRLIDYCAAREKFEPTPCDLTYRELSIPEVDRLNRKYSLTDIYPLTPLQEGMLFHNLYNKQSSAYFEQFSYRLSGRLDISLVEKSINRLFERYEILRTAFVYEGLPRPLQIVLRERKVDFYYEDVSGIAPVEERERYIREYKEKDRRRSFNLSNGVLMRAAVLKTDMEEYEFIWSFHHILMDGWCIGILNNEFLQVYNCCLHNREWRPTGVKPYRIYIQWLEEQDKKAPAEFWKNYLADYEESAGLPKSKTGPAAPAEGYKLDHVVFTLEKEKIHDLKRIAGSRRATLNILLQSAWGILLAKYNGKRDVVFASVVSGRPYEIEGVESMVGLFINTIPVRIRFHPGATFDHLLRRTSEEAVQCKPHHYYPLAKIQAQTRLKQHLLDHLFVFENYPIAEQIDGVIVDDKEPRGVKADLSRIDTFEQTDYDFGVVVSGGKQLTVSLDFNANVYEKPMLQRVARHLNLLLEEIIARPDRVIDQAAIISEEEKHQILYEFNDTRSDYPADKTIHELFEEQVERTPDRVAIIHLSIQITYNELNKHSNRLASYLREKGVQSDIIVGIKIERSIEMIVGILGILKAGGAFLPLNPGYPQKRIDYMLKDSAAKVLVTTSTLTVEVEKLRSWEVKRISLEEIFKISPGFSQPLNLSTSQLPGSSNLAYVIYTSGTTGLPKGAMINHASLMNQCTWHIRYYDVTGNDRSTQYAGIGFDAMIFEIFPYLVGGAALYIISDDIKLDIPALKKYYNKNHITITFLSTQFCQQFMEEETETPSLRAIITGGEKLNRFIKRNYRLYNNYGPTENTVVAAVYSVEKPQDNIPIGKPIQNNRIYILDKNSLQPQPIGVPEELCIAGDSLARGYLNRPELTAEKFLQLTLNTKHLTLYKTGDLARWLPDGNIEFLGRMDSQVKIRGFRIELGEIESRLQEIPAVKEACVIDREKKSGEKYLWAYLVPEKPLEPLNPTEVRNILGKHLPDYMVPARFIPVERIPLTPNGKIDKQALLAREFTPTTDYVAPKNKTEKIIAGIWKEVLELEKVGANDNFFEAGGTSLDVIQVTTRMKKALNRDIPVVHLFQYPTVSALAGYFDREETGSGFAGDDRGKAVARGKEKRKKRSQKKRGKK